LKGDLEMKNYFDIFMAFLRPGIFGFGGGQATIPLIQQEVVENFNWLSMPEFTDALALGNSLPGPITTKMAALIGYKAGGVVGSLVALAGLILPSAIAIIILLNIYTRFKEARWLKGMMTGVRPVVVILIFNVVMMMAKKSFPNTQTYIIAGVASVAVFVFNVHPVVLIIAALTYGGFFLS
jgi:chromate transporter